MRTKNFTLFLLSFLLLIFVLSGCIIRAPLPEESGQVIQCISLCQQKISNGANLSNGPCLAENYVNDWVCDVAHSPRQPVDNLPENQCPTFRQGNAHHFVEVDEECNVIKVY